MNKKMNKKTKIILSVALLILIAILAAGFVFMKQNRESSHQMSQPSDGPSSAAPDPADKPETKPADKPETKPGDKPSDKPGDRSQSPAESPNPAKNKEPSPQKQAGYYGEYSQNRVGAQGYDKTILFFYAPWCSECRAFEQAIKSSAIPAGVQILKVDYDKRQDLRQKYGVRTQSTFVRLKDGSSNVWVGYGKDKSVDAILRNL